MKKAILGLFVFALGFLLPTIPNVYADLGSPTTVVPIEYDATYDYYRAFGSGHETDLLFREYPTLDLAVGDIVTLSISEKVIGSKAVAPIFRIGWEQSSIKFYDIQPKSGNDSTYLSATENYNSDGNIYKTWYFANSQDSATLLYPNESAEYYIYFKYDSLSNYFWYQESEMHSKRWTFNAGWYEGAQGYIYDEVAATEGMLLEK
jgi:hypothetical protein